MLRKTYQRNLKAKRAILIIFLTLVGSLFSPSVAYSKVPLLYKWEDNDRISIRVITSQKVISKSTEGGETITLPDVGPSGEKRSDRLKRIVSWSEGKSNTNKVLSYKEKKGENGIFKGVEIEVHEPDGSLIKKVVLDKDEIDSWSYRGNSASMCMSPRENYLIYQTKENEKWTLWADPLIKGTSPIPVFTQEEHEIVEALSPDETKFALKAIGGNWGHSVLIIPLDNVSNISRVTMIEEPFRCYGGISWSPGGTYLTYTECVSETEDKAYLVSLKDGQKTLLNDKFNLVSLFKWSENKLYFIGDRNILMEIDLPNPEKPHVLLEFPKGAMNFLTKFSLDKSKIATITSESSGRETIFRLWWNYIYKDEPWKQLFEYNPQ